MASSNYETGIMSFEEFTAGIKAFVSVSDRKGDGWMLKESPTEKNLLYLVKKELKSLHLGEKINDVSMSDFSSLMNDMELFDSEDAVILNSETASEKILISPTSEALHQELEMCSVEYHIVYNTSYYVPVLFLNIYKSNGKLLSLDELWQSIPAYYHERLNYERWSLITQSEHPILGTPFFQLHPCHTSDLMKTVSNVGNCVVPSEQSHHLRSQSRSLEPNRVKSWSVNKSRKVKPANDTENDLSHERDVYSENPVLETLTEMTKVGCEETMISKHYLGYKYLISWLSAVAPVVQLNIPLAYALYSKH